MLGEDQSDYDGLSPQEQIDIFERVSRRTAVAMIKQIEALKAEITKLRKDKDNIEEALAGFSKAVCNSDFKNKTTVVAHLVVHGLWRTPEGVSIRLGDGNA